MRVRPSHIHLRQTHNARHCRSVACSFTTPPVRFCVCAGAFVYARSPELPVELEDRVARVARSNGLDPNKFCKIRNACFLDPPKPSLTEPAGMALAEPQSVWRRWTPSRLGQKVGQLSSAVRQELSDWFEDPSTTSDWLIRQQERVVLRDSTMLPSTAVQQPPASSPPPSPSILARQNGIYDD